MASGGSTGFTRSVTGEEGAAEETNQLMAAWEGDDDRGVPLDLTEVEHATKYALDVRNKEATSSLVARYRNAAGEELLALVKEAVRIGKPCTFSGTVTFRDTVTMPDDFLSADATGLAMMEDGFLAASEAGRAKMAGGFVTAAKVAADVATQAELDTHTEATTGIHGAVSAATANKLLIRDAAGRAKVVAPAVASDIALQSTVTADIATHQALTSPHSATAAATPNRLPVRDAAGRFGVVAPAGPTDIALKSTVTTDIATHQALTSPHSATPDPTASRLVVRDASGRAAVAAPSAATDIALKSTVTADIATHQALTSPHSATPDPTASRLIVRDASGRAAVAAPAAADDIARKDTVDTHAALTTAHGSSGVVVGKTTADATYAPIAKGVTNGDAHNHVGGDGAAIAAGGLADGAVDTTARLANNIVDDTKVGNRVPQFYRRQGGSATYWDTVGTTDYTPTSVRMQAGAIQVIVPNGATTGNTTITFPVAFSAKPLVFVTLLANDANLIYAGYQGVGASTVRIDVHVSGTTGDRGFNVNWLAIGSE